MEEFRRERTGQRAVHETQGVNKVREADKYSSILMFGVPGSGKGTQGVILGEMPNLVHLAMGDIFRGLDKESDIGKEFLSYSTKGMLVPDELTIRVFRHHVDEMIKSGEIDLAYHTLILDGIPRTVEQVNLLRDVINVKRVIYLMMEDREALVARLAGRATKSNRPDDADRSVIENRIDVFERETHPVLDAYPKKLIARVNADQPPLAVLRDCADYLVGYVSARL
jgi:adenylate kinase